ncbi:hypothetical protein M514_09632 [Trichuris suis]|uniref:Uncharacterized protein n=1 Tax=Trichuris suis TaxID=68888 RepID=A0A085N8A1_9BILA|nr:hypothetical protein M513_09632 [Trichuris suis]KFD65697.1 hypothetical protein M514_09632 [Trichuris suis]
MGAQRREDAFYQLCPTDRLRINDVTRLSLENIDSSIYGKCSAYSVFELTMLIVALTMDSNKFNDHFPAHRFAYAQSNEEAELLISWESFLPFKAILTPDRAHNHQMSTMPEA